MIRVALVGCSKTKLTTPGPHRVRDLYASDLFRLAMAYADKMLAEPVILSAKYGAILEGRMIDAYELSLNDLSIVARGEWARRVANTIRVMLPPPGVTLVALCGEPYVAAIEPYLAGYRIERPLRGLGIGQRKAWLAQALKEAA